MRTAGQFQQDSPFTDGQIFVGPGSLGLVVTSPSIALGNAGTNYAPAYFNCTTGGATFGFLFNVGAILRTGTAPNYQEQFGTKALVPGPSSVANTSDPLNLTGMPPTKKASLATLTGGANGFIDKGFQLNWIDVIYSTGANALSSAAIGVSAIQFVNNVAPSVTTLLAYGANGLPTAAQTNPYVTRVTPTTIQFNTVTDTEVQVLMELIAGATATLQVFGFVLGVSFNFN